jgi:beta-glucanase (GH16 family)
MTKSLAILALTTVNAAEKLVFSDEFTHLDFSKWKHEITLSGGGNWEFEYYTNNRTNSFVQNNTLFLQPSFTNETMGEDQMEHGTLNLWGGSPADKCTSNAFWGCERNAAASQNYINPIQSARIRTAETFAFKYGRAEIRAQLPKGDWIWPAIWFLPKDNNYGQWPASGEIDLVESRGTSGSCEGGRNSFGSTLHYGPGWPYDAWEKAHADYVHTSDLSDAMHIYGLEWTEKGIKTTIDGKTVLDYTFDDGNFKKGGFPESLENPWEYETEKSAPFNQEMFIVMNVAVGGTNSYFPDGVCNKPWANNDPHAPNTFWNARDTWAPTWNLGTHDSAMKVDYVRVYQNDANGDEKEVKSEFVN